jgi:hypothetical protein
MKLKRAVGQEITDTTVVVLVEARGRMTSEENLLVRSDEGDLDGDGPGKVLKSQCVVGHLALRRGREKRAEGKDFCA